MFKLPHALIAALLLAMAPLAQGAVIVYTADLSGPAESPPNASPGTGFAQVIYDSVGQTLTISASFQDLVGPTTVAHIHCCTATPLTDNVGVAVTPGTLPGFPVGVTSGSYDPVVIDLTATASYTAGFLTNFGGGTPAGAEAALIAGMNGDTAYFNIHSSVFPAGEIRGFLAPIPLPAGAWLLASAVAVLAPLRRRVLRPRS
ncbi:MAG: CHRD domain-containing protein [Chromatiales bacterium]|nr:CHRD domain-containing protein [Chromatiales bacterium]